MSHNFSSSWYDSSDRCLSSIPSFLITSPFTNQIDSIYPALSSFNSLILYNLTPLGSQYDSFCDHYLNQIISRVHKLKKRFSSAFFQYFQCHRVCRKSLLSTCLTFMCSFSSLLPPYCLSCLATFCQFLPRISWLTCTMIHH